jgi:hypothetical protein
MASYGPGAARLVVGPMLWLRTWSTSTNPRRPRVPQPPFPQHGFTHEMALAAENRSFQALSGLGLEVGATSHDLFNATVTITVGSGTSTLFWEDAWIGDLTTDTIAPVLMKHTRSSIHRMSTVADGVLNHSWAHDICGELSVDVIRVTSVCGVRFRSCLALVMTWKTPSDRSGRPMVLTPPNHPI